MFVVGAPPQIPGTPPPAYSEMPPPYAPPISMNTEPSVICRVCQQLIYIRGREHQRVVKCGNCQEATVSNVNIFLKYIAIVISLKEVIKDVLWLKASSYQSTMFLK